MSVETNLVRVEVLKYRLEKLEEQVDIYWRQRAHVKWLEKGARNTSFFHVTCKERKRYNRIARLKKDDGSWVEGEEEKRRFISNYFYTRFRSNGPADCQQLLQAVERRVTSEMNATLTREFSAEEVKSALNSIGDMKAPGPHGMPSIFYKRFWENVGGSNRGSFISFKRGSVPRWGGMKQLSCLFRRCQNQIKLKIYGLSIKDLCRRYLQID
jgi:hypothetical protein